MNVGDNPRKLPRAQDPEYIRNPYTGRYVRRGGKKHKSLLTDGLLERPRLDDNVVATGTRSELETMKKKLEESRAFDLTGYILNIRGNTLIKQKKVMTRREMTEHTTRHAIDAAVSNRDLMNSSLTNEQITEILKRVCDAKIIGAPFDLDKEFHRVLELSANKAPPPLPSTPPPSLSPGYEVSSLGYEVSSLGRSSVQSPPPSPKKRGRPRRRFHVAKAPVYDTTDFGETTGVESETEFSD